MIVNLGGGGSQIGCVWAPVVFTETVGWVNVNAPEVNRTVLDIDYHDFANELGGFTGAEGDRILLTAQHLYEPQEGDPVDIDYSHENGIWIYHGVTAPMTRAPDMANTDQMLSGGFVTEQFNDIDGQFPRQWVLQGLDRERPTDWRLGEPGCSLLFQRTERVSTTPTPGEGGVDADALIGSEIKLLLDTAPMGARSAAGGGIQFLDGGMAADWSYVPSLQRFTIGDGVETVFPLVHELSNGAGTRDVLVQFYALPAGGPVDPAPVVERTDLNTVTLTFDAPPDTDSVRVLLYGCSQSPWTDL